MSRTYKDSKGRGRAPQRLTVRGGCRDPVDVRKLSRAIIMLAQAQAEADAKAATEASSDSDAPKSDTSAGAEGGGQ